MIKVKVFVHASNADSDSRTMTSVPDICPGLLKKTDYQLKRLTTRQCEIIAVLSTGNIKGAYCKRGNFRVGVIFTFFALLSSPRKLPPRENKTHMPF